MNQVLKQRVIQHMSRLILSMMTAVKRLVEDHPYTENEDGVEHPTPRKSTRNGK